MIHFHKWTRWETRNGTIHYKDGSSIPITVQTRMCKKCGLTQTDRWDV